MLLPILPAAGVNVVDRIFPIEQSDVEMGDVYEQYGYKGVYDLEKQRRENGLIIPDHDIAVDVAQAFGVSPGDLYDDEAAAFDPAALAAYYMGQGA